ncbi:aminotransferase class V-fold PLP-dependent enzyme [Pseudalkalibacillus sp. A8]|uniref:aminotransferase class V-fold PLP-dependent enzyme n=1 Tax=Pseudalkalibacillus sp. A8 TaxID=3382641 RepID=UPI0038B64950
MNKSIYLDYASMGITSNETIKTIERMMRKLVLSSGNITGTDRTFELLGVYEETRETIARFLDTTSQQIALINNTTHGLGLIATSLSLKKTDHILVPDIEFISLALVWRRLQKKIGFKIREIPTRKGTIDIKDILDRADEHTRVIVLSAVQEVSGHRIDLDQFSQFTKKNDIFLIVDGIQECGVHKVNVSAADAYIVGGHKWLGSPFGLGFMYLSRRLINQVDPAYDGYFNLEEPIGGWERYLQSRNRHILDNHVVKNEARKFEPGGMPNFTGALGLNCAIKNLDMEQVEEKVKVLNRVFRDNLRSMNLENFILGNKSIKHRSGILTLSLSGGFEEEKKLLATLRKHDIQTSLRSIAGVGGIRFSFYFPTTIDDINRTSEIIEHLRNRLG